MKGLPLIHFLLLAEFLQLVSARIIHAHVLDRMTPRASPTTNALWGSAYGNGLFVVVGLNGTILTSPEGAQWTARNSGVTNDLYDIAFADGLFVAVGGTDETTTNTIVLTSSDAVSWTPRAAPAVGPIYAIAYGLGKFVAWAYTEAYEPNPDTLVTLLESTNGISWTARSSLRNLYLPDMKFLEGLFIAVGEDYNDDAPGYPAVLTSTNGLNWTRRVVPGGEGLRGISWANGTFVTLGEAGTIFTSTNTIDWINQFHHSFKSLLSTTFGDGRFVAVGGAFEPSILSSADGIAWTNHLFGLTGLLTTVTYAKGTFVTAGLKGGLYQSVPIAPVLSASNRPGDGFEVRLRGDQGHNYEVHVSTNLSTTNWTLLQSFTLVQDRTNILDTTATNSNQRFYRAVAP